MRRHAGTTSGADPNPSVLRSFTIHLEFLAVDEAAAVAQAAAYAEALNTLRPEVGTYGARVSTHGNWSVSSPVYCGAPGPRPHDMCTEITGHAGGRHRQGTLRRWTDDEVPQVPNDIAGCWDTETPDEGEGFEVAAPE